MRSLGAIVSPSLHFAIIAPTGIVQGRTERKQTVLDDALRPDTTTRVKPSRRFGNGAQAE
jgi:hypothetical protein